MTEPAAPPTDTTAPALGEEWYCDQCGARYPQPGLCSNQHPPAELKPVDADVVTDAPNDEGLDTPPVPADVTATPAPPAPAAPATPVEAPAAADPLAAAIAALKDALATLEAAQAAETAAAPPA